MKHSAGLAIYSLGHFLVDAACCLVMLVSVRTVNGDAGNFTLAIILYNTVAFALQPFFGLGVDKYGFSNYMASIGAFIVGVSALFLKMPYAAAVSAGLGNAMYHIGGGTYSLNIDRSKASYAGIFVAPGALGLLFGALVARKADFSIWYVLMPMLILGICTLWIKHIRPVENGKYTNQKTSFWTLSLLFLAVVIALRAVIGSAAVFTWKNNDLFALFLVGTVAGGKALGGILSDRIGRGNTAVSGLLLSAPLLAFCNNNIILSLMGVFLFNLTMAVTLTEIADRLYGYSGFAFGLTTLALIVGTYMMYFGWGSFLGTPPVIFLMVLISAGFVWFAICKGIKDDNKKMGVEML